MKKKLLTIVLSMVLSISMVFSVAAKTYTKSGYAAKAGSEVFYAFTSSSSSTALYKVNVNTKKKTKIKLKTTGNLGNFTSINVKGGYIYCAATYKDNASKTTHIYRIDIKTGSLKRLASGMNPTIVGSKVVYEQTTTIRIDANQINFQSVPTGKVKEMDLNGKNKKDAVYNFKDAEATYISGSKQTAIKKGKYKYSIASKGKTIVRKKGKTKKTIFKTKYKIIGFRVLSGYLVIKTAGKDKMTAYGVKTSGKKKVKLASWSVK